MTREAREILNLVILYVQGAAWLAGTVVLLMHHTSWAGVAAWILACIICTNWSEHCLMKGSTG